MQAKPLLEIHYIEINLYTNRSNEPDYNFLAFGGGVDCLKTWLKGLLIAPQIINSKPRSSLEQV